MCCRPGSVTFCGRMGRSESSGLASRCVLRAQCHDDDSKSRQRSRLPGTGGEVEHDGRLNQGSDESLFVKRRICQRSSCSRSSVSRTHLESLVRRVAAEVMLPVVFVLLRRKTSVACQADQLEPDRTSNSTR